METGTLLFKEDWPETKERFIQWWNHEYFGRCAVSVKAPKDNPPDVPPPPPPISNEQKNHDPGYVGLRMAYNLSHTYFGGEAVPIWEDGYRGCLWLPVMLGCKAEVGPETSWTHPCLLDPDQLDVSGLRLDEKDATYQKKLAMDLRAVKESLGKSIPSSGAFGGGGDTLAAMRGTEQLLVDCVERPGAVRAAETHLMDIWIDYYGRCHQVLREAAQGSAGWFPLWSPGKFYAVQNDFSYNIGPEMFREVFLPAIRRQTEYLDYSIYHVDGVSSFRHVDALLTLPRLQALQILPGAGQPSPLHYLDVLRKVQAAGKNLHVSISIEEVEQALKLLSAKGLFINTTAKTETEAQKLLENAEKWSKETR